MRNSSQRFCFFACLLFTHSAKAEKRSSVAKEECKRNLGSVLGISEQLTGKVELDYSIAACQGLGQPPVLEGEERG